MAHLTLICATFVPHGTAEWLARVSHVRSRLAIGEWCFSHPRPYHGSPLCIEMTPSLYSFMLERELVAGTDGPKWPSKALVLGPVWLRMGWERANRARRSLICSSNPSHAGSRQWCQFPMKILSSRQGRRCKTLPSTLMVYRHRTLLLHTHTQTERERESKKKEREKKIPSLRKTLPIDTLFFQTSSFKEFPMLIPIRNHFELLKLLLPIPIPIPYGVPCLRQSASLSLRAVSVTQSCWTVYGKGCAWQRVLHKIVPGSSKQKTEKMPLCYPVPLKKCFTQSVPLCFSLVWLPLSRSLSTCAKVRHRKRTGVGTIFREEKLGRDLGSIMAILLASSRRKMAILEPRAQPPVSPKGVETRESYQFVIFRSSKSYRFVIPGNKFSSTHPSHDVVFSSQTLAKNRQK